MGLAIKTKKYLDNTLPFLQGHGNSHLSNPQVVAEQTIFN